MIKINGFLYLLTHCLIVITFFGCSTTDNRNEAERSYKYEIIDHTDGFDFEEYCTKREKQWLWALNNAVIGGRGYQPTIHLKFIPTSNNQNLLEGYCNVAYDVNELGIPTNIRIAIEGCSNELFSDMSLKGASMIRYCPYILNGNTISLDNVKYRFNFSKK